MHPPSCDCAIMQSFRLPSTILNFTASRGLPSLRDAAAEVRQADETTISPERDEELKMPKKASLVIIILANVMLQVRAHNSLDSITC